MQPGRVITVSALAAAFAAAGALAATKDPKSFSLQLSDFPAGTHAGLAYPLSGPKASLYTAAFNIRPGDIEHEEDVSLEVWVAKDEAGAKTLYEQTLGTYTGKVPGIGAPPGAFKGESVLSLPKYGDEQYADYIPKSTRPHGQLIVRKGTVVWYLTVENCTNSAPSCYGTSRTEAPIGKPKAIAELERYGAKVARRVG